SRGLHSQLGNQSRQRSLLRVERSGPLGQDTSCDQPAIELARRDPGQQIVELAAGCARRGRRMSDEDGMVAVGYGLVVHPFVVARLPLDAEVARAGKVLPL